jgi:hypothetical protein
VALPQAVETHDSVEPEPQLLETLESCALQVIEGFDVVASEVENLQVGEIVVLQQSYRPRVFVPV